MGHTILGIVQHFGVFTVVWPADITVRRQVSLGLPFLLFPFGYLSQCCPSGAAWVYLCACVYVRARGWGWVGGGADSEGE